MATLKSYDDAGHLIETDRGTTTSITGSPFRLNNWAKDTLDPDGNKALEITGTGTGVNATTTTATQFSYDGANRVLCSAKRMNPVQYASLPSDACSVGPAGSYGPDRITKMVYDVGGQARQEIRAFGTSVQQVYATHDYEPDGKEVAIADSDAGLAIGAYNLDETAAHAHQTNYAYDGFDRLITTTYADGTRDRVITYDNDGNVKKRKTRANDTITYTYDTNDRMATKTVPAVTVGTVTAPANTVSWTYDLMNEVTNLTDTNGNNLVSTYDLIGRQLTASQTLPGMTGGAKTVTYTYDDGAGDKVDRSQIAWPDGWFVNYNYDALGHMTSATDSDGTALATRTYDDYTRLATQQYPYVNDNISWAWTSEDDLQTMTNNVALSASDVSFTNSFTLAHQWNSSNISNAAYKYTPSNTGTDACTPDASGLNQYATVTPAGGSAQTIGYDARGNLTGDGTRTFPDRDQQGIYRAKFPTMKLTIALIAQLLAACSPQTFAPLSSGENQTSLCKILSAPDDYSGKTVTVRASFQSTPHGSLLFDNSCSGTFVTYRLSNGFAAAAGVVEAIEDRQRQKSSQIFEIEVQGTFSAAQPGQCFDSFCDRYELRVSRLNSARPL